MAMVTAPRMQNIMGIHKKNILSWPNHFKLLWFRAPTVGPYHVMRSSADYFRSKCSKKGWRPRKRPRQRFQCKQQVEQEEHEQTDASDPAGTLSTLLVDGPSPDFNANLKQIIDLYNQTLTRNRFFFQYPDQNWHQPWDIWHDCFEPVHVEQVPIGVGETIQVPCAQCGCECQSTSSDYLLLSWCDRCWCAED